MLQIVIFIKRKTGINLGFSLSTPYKSRYAMWYIYVHSICWVVYGVYICMSLSS